MINQRHRARTLALQILYREDVQHMNGLPSPGLQWLASELSTHFSHFVVPEAVREFASELVLGSTANMASIDTAIEGKSAHWKLARMSVIDRSILRMALFEMLYLKDSIRAVVINEAVELAKEFGSTESAAFINGILDSIPSPQNSQLSS